MECLQKETKTCEDTENKTQDKSPNILWCKMRMNLLSPTLLYFGGGYCL